MKRVLWSFARNAALAAATGMMLVGCGTDLPVEPLGPPSVFDPREQREREKYGTILGEEGITLFSRGRARTTPEPGGGIGVNAYLWRASLETIDFMPLASADPFGGLIITDWYRPSSAEDERLKLQILIRDTLLRADGVKVSVFRQRRQDDGWVDAPVDPKTAIDIEDKILTRARQLRVASAEALR